MADYARFAIINDLPYLVSHGTAYTVCLNDVGFNIGEKADVEIPDVLLSELSIRAKCKKIRSSIIEA